MTSQIVSDTIDETYPVAGQDNDSQGFRDNFSIIKDGLATAASEITDLQNNTAKLNEDNNFNGTLIDNAQTNRLYGTVYSLTTVSGTNIIDYNNGEYQVITITGNHTLRFQNWPTRSDEVPVYAKMRIALVPDSSTTYTVTFTTVNGNIITPEGSTSGGVTIQTGNVAGVATVVEAWTASDTTNDVYFVKIAEFDRTFELGDLSNVNVPKGSEPNPVEGSYLRFINNEWTNDTEGPRASIVSLHEDIDNVEITTPGGEPANGDILVYNSQSELWTNVSRVRDIEDLENVSAASAQVGDVIRYTGVPNVVTSWRSERDPNIHFYQVSLPPNFDGNDGYSLDGAVIENGMLTFYPGNIYRFYLNNPNINSFNEQSGLRFSRDPAGLQPYEENVTISGVSGSEGSYIEIEVTKDTPTPLYIYGGPGTAGTGPFPLGQNVPIPVVKDSFYTGSEDLTNGGTASSILKTTYFITNGAETGTLGAGVEGQLKVFAMRSYSGDMVITVTNPGWTAAATGTITFNSLGQACTLQYIANKWICIGNNGATFA